MATAMQLADYIDYAGLPFKKEAGFIFCNNNKHFFAVWLHEGNFQG